MSGVPSSPLIYHRVKRRKNVNQNEPRIESLWSRLAPAAWLGFFFFSSDVFSPMISLGETRWRHTRRRISCCISAGRSWRGCICTAKTPAAILGTEVELTTSLRTNTSMEWSLQTHACSLIDISLIFSVSSFYIYTYIPCWIVHLQWGTTWIPVYHLHPFYL